MRPLLVSGFASVADGEDHDLLSLVVIQDNIRALAEFNDPLPKLRRQFVHGASNLRMGSERFDSLANCLDGALRRVAAFGSEKIIETRHVQQRRT